MTPELSWIFVVFLAACKAKAQFGQLPPPRASRMGVEGPSDASEGCEGLRQAQ